jgi:dihydroxy-acid dehydratase
MDRRLRSADWFGGTDLNSFVHRAWLKAEGFTDDAFRGRPVIGIANSWSEVANCNSHLREHAERVARGVWRAGGVPLEFPVMSLSEPLMKPTTMLYRNLMALEVEEYIRSLPFDAVVLLSGCDKTAPALLMGAASADVPAILFPGGPMLSGRLGTAFLGCGEDLAEAWKAEQLSGEAPAFDLERSVTRSRGHCQVMGTASTMACLAEALGMTLPGAAAIPAADSRRLELAEETGDWAVRIAKAGTRPSSVLTEAAFRNAIRVLMAIGGSTNGVIHLIAIARRAGIALDLDTFDRLGRETPVLVNLRPTGDALMEDFFYAGGVSAVLGRLAPLLEEASDVTGRTVGASEDPGPVHDDAVIRPLGDPISPEGGIAVLRGNLCPDGAVIKQSAASPALLRHRGRAVVFEDRRDLMARIDDPDLNVDADSVLVLKLAGPRGGPGMPEWGRLPIPAKLAAQGVTDMVRISDARMSGTGFGTCVLHVAPESAIGGPLALVRDGDEIELDVPNRRLELLVSPAELDARRSDWVPPTPAFESGYGWLHLQHVLQAPDGADLDFVASKPGERIRAYEPAGF